MKVKCPECDKEAILQIDEQGGVFDTYGNETCHKEIISCNYCGLVRSELKPNK